MRGGAKRWRQILSLKKAASREVPLALSSNSCFPQFPSVIKPSIKKRTHSQVTIPCRLLACYIRSSANTTNAMPPSRAVVKEYIETTAWQYPCPAHTALKCHACHLTARRPAVCMNHGHTFCDDCATSLATQDQEHSRCPVDRSDILRMKDEPSDIRKSYESFVKDIFVKCNLGEFVHSLAELFELQYLSVASSRARLWMDRKR